MASKSITIYQGSDVTLVIDFQDKNKNPVQPLSLEGFTGTTAYFPAASGGALPVFGGLVSSDLGRVSFSLDEDQTNAIVAGDEQNLEVHVDQGAKRTISQILGKLSVIAQLFAD